MPRSRAVTPFSHTLQSNEKRVAPEQRKLLEESFERVFSKVALKDLQNVCMYSHEKRIIATGICTNAFQVLHWDAAPSEEDFLQNKSENYRAYEFLLKKIKSLRTNISDKASERYSTERIFCAYCHLALRLKLTAKMQPIPGLHM